MNKNKKSIVTLWIITGGIVGYVVGYGIFAMHENFLERLGAHVGFEAAGCGPLDQAAILANTLWEIESGSGSIPEFRGFQSRIMTRKTYRYGYSNICGGLYFGIPPLPNPLVPVLLAAAH